MSFAGATAARGATTVQLPLGQLALVGLGAFCVANPDKFFESVGKGILFLSSTSGNNNNNNGNNGNNNNGNLIAAPQPIVIHHNTPPAAPTSKKSYIITLVLSGAVCWGSYVVLARILPDSAKGMLPVSTSLFNRSVSSLGRALINLKDTLLQQMHALRQQHEDLSQQQQDTHQEVLNVKGSLTQLNGSMDHVQEALDVCQASLAQSERRTSYIANGIQLLTRGVSTFLPEDDALLHELVQFTISGDDFTRSGQNMNPTTPLQQHRLQQQAMQMIQRRGSGGNDGNNSSGEIITLPFPTSTNNGNHQNDNDPENEVPSTPPINDDVEGSLTEVLALMHSVRSGSGAAAAPTRAASQ